MSSFTILNYLEQINKKRTIVWQEMEIDDPLILIYKSVPSGIFWQFGCNVATDLRINNFNF